MKRVTAALSLLALMSATPIAVGARLTPLATGRLAPTRHAVGFETLRVPNGSEPDLIGAVWYPTAARPSPEQLEGFVQNVAAGAPVAGTRLPLIVISHGGGGSFAGHYDTAMALARAGYVVASVNHAGDSSDDQSRVIEQWRRPAQLSRLIDYVLGGWSGRQNIDAGRVGAFGFSNGGFTVLVAAGGTPDLNAIDPYCRMHPTHDLCTTLASAGVKSLANVLPRSIVWNHDVRIRAVAAAAPAFGFTFDRADLASVRIPVLLWRGAEDRHQPSPFYEEHIRDRLPHAPEYRVERDAGHYSFLPPCNPALEKAVPAICVDKPGFDRAGFHRRLNADLVRFFDRALPARL